jgi:hypothetical protein
MYFNPYYLGLILGICTGVSLIFVILLIAAIISANKGKKHERKSS